MKENGHGMSELIIH